MNEDQTQNIRRLALKTWLHANGGARYVCTQKGVGKSVESHISQMLRGYSFGARAARNLEIKLGIPHGLLDRDPTALQADHLVSPILGASAAELLDNYSQSIAPRTDLVHIPQYRMTGLINKDGAGRAFSGSGTRLLLRDQPGLITDVTVTREWLQKNVSAYSSPENLRIVTGFGDSMRPVFKPGDPLIVDTGHTTISFDAVYFFRVDGEGFGKRLQRVPGEGIRVLSSNKAYESWTVKPEMDFEVLGRIIKAWTSEDF